MAAVYLSMYLSATGAPGSRRPCGAMPAKAGFLKFASYITGNIREHHVTASSYPRSGVSAGLGRSGLPSRARRSVWYDLGNLGEGTPALHPEAYRGACRSSRSPTSVRGDSPVLTWLRGPARVSPAQLFS